MSSWKVSTHWFATSGRSEKLFLLLLWLIVCRLSREDKSADGRGKFVLRVNEDSTAFFSQLTLARINSQLWIFEAWKTRANSTIFPLAVNEFSIPFHRCSPSRVSVSGCVWCDDDNKQRLRKAFKSPLFACFHAHFFTFSENEKKTQIDPMKINFPHAELRCAHAGVARGRSNKWKIIFYSWVFFSFSPPTSTLMKMQMEYEKTLSIWDGNSQIHSAESSRAGKKHFQTFSSSRFEPGVETANELKNAWRLKFSGCLVLALAEFELDLTTPEFGSRCK